MKTQHGQRGIASIEFALVSVVFLVVVFGIVQVARAAYMVNTLADVTRSAARAAANTDWRNGSEMGKLRQRAVYRDSPGLLPFGAPVTDRHVRIDYLYLKKEGAGTVMEPIAAMPSCPGRNRHNCLTNPYGAGTSPETVCVRLVRARICRPDRAGCEAVHLDPLLPGLGLDIRLPTSTTIVSAETLGYRPGDSVCQ